MVSANREMVVYCFDTLVAHYNNEEAPPPAFDEGQHPLFVTWKKVTNGGEPRLRGCIGTLEARCIVNGFRDYALTSALRDWRFPPIQAKELPTLECTVSILTNYETARDNLDWEHHSLSRCQGYRLCEREDCVAASPTAGGIDKQCQLGLQTNRAESNTTRLELGSIRIFTVRARLELESSFHMLARARLVIQI